MWLDKIAQWGGFKILYLSAREANVKVRKAVGLKARTLLFASNNRKLKPELKIKAGMNKCVTWSICFIIRIGAGL
jgi:hypothetical protein